MNTHLQLQIGSPQLSQSRAPVKYGKIVIAPELGKTNEPYRTNLTKEQSFFQEKSANLLEDLDFYQSLLAPARSNSQTLREEQTLYERKQRLRLKELQKKTGGKKGNAIEEIDALIERDDTFEDEEMQSKFKCHLKMIRQFIDRTMRDNNIKIQLLKGKLKNRELTLAEQRKLYLQELSLLREELFRKKQDSNYIPTDYQLTDWSKNPIGEAPVEKKPEIVKHVPTKEDEQLYDTLKRQSDQVAKTLQNLKKLEKKKKDEIQSLQMKQKEYEKLKLSVQVPSSTKGVRELKTKDRTSSQKKKRGASNQTPQSQGSWKSSLRDSSGKKNSFSPFIIQETEEDEEDFGGPYMDDDDVVKSLLLRSSGAKKFVGEKPDQNMMLLEGKISNFQEKFSHLFQQMHVVKHRINTYSEEKTKQLEQNVGPEGEVTLAFTDVQSSTKLWELNAEAMRESIQVHNEIIREIILEEKGFEVKTEGDAFMVAFSNPENACRFALKTQLRLIHAHWPEDVLELHPARLEYDEQKNLIYRGLRVRIGLHTGSPICHMDTVTNRTDYLGPMVNKSARIEGCADGGQVMISTAVYERVSEKLENLFEEEIGIVEHPDQELKGIPGKETVYHIYPMSLKDREFDGVTKQDDENDKEEAASGIEDLHQKLKELEIQHSLLERERNEIQTEMKSQMQIDSYEEVLQERDTVIESLKEKLSSSYNNPNETKLQKEEKLKLQNDLSKVMNQYERMNAEYQKMKENYARVVKAFNTRLQREMDSFKEDLQVVKLSLVSKERQISFEQSHWQKEKVEMKENLTFAQKELSEKNKLISNLKTKLQNLELSKAAHQIHPIGQFSSSMVRVQAPILAKPMKPTSLKMNQKQFHQELLKRKSFDDVANMMKDAVRERGSFDLNLTISKGKSKKIKQQKTEISTQTDQVNQQRNQQIVHVPNVHSTARSEESSDLSQTSLRIEDLNSSQQNESQNAQNILAQKPPKPTKQKKRPHTTGASSRKPIMHSKPKNRPQSMSVSKRQHFSAPKSIKSSRQSRPSSHRYSPSPQISSYSRMLQSAKKSRVKPMSQISQEELQSRSAKTKRVKKLLDLSQTSASDVSIQRYLHARNSKKFQHVLSDEDDDFEENYQVNPNASVVVPSQPSFSTLFDEIASVRRLLSHRRERREPVIRKFNFPESSDQ